MASDFTIFLIDDDPAILKSLDRLLQAAGYETKAYLSAETFLTEHDPSTPGCAVLDLAMPHSNGLHVQQALTRQGNNRPVIFLTGRASVQESVEAMKAGATDFLNKPIDKSELLRAIKLAEERDKTQRHNEARHKIIIEKMAKLTRSRKRDTQPCGRRFVKQANCGSHGSDREDNQGAPYPRFQENGCEKLSRTSPNDGGISLRTK